MVPWPKPISTRRATLYSVVPPGKTTRVKDINLGFIDPQSVTMACRVVSIGELSERK